MTRNLLFIFVILLLVYCTNNTKNKEVVVVELVAPTLTLEFASKNPETTKNKEGTHVGVNEMLHLILADNNISISMNGKGRSIDNIAIERFFRSLKYEDVYLHDYSSVSQLKHGVAQYMYFYNYNRFHSTLNYRKPWEVYLQKAA